MASKKPTGKCPVCHTQNLVLQDDGTLPPHRIWVIKEERFVDCPYEGTPG